MNPLFAHEPLVFVDLETTGANFANDRVIEIGIVQVDQDGGAREWSSLVNPGTSISSFITGLTGITSEMVATAPSFEQLLPIIIEKLSGRLFIAHNSRFDYSFQARIRTPRGSVPLTESMHSQTIPKAFSDASPA